jgi:hypothetical protein
MLEESPDVFYVDVQVSNINNGEQSTTVPAKYNQTRTIPWLYKPDEYYGAITQFTLNNTDTPFIDVIIQPNQGFVNLTIYQIALSYQGVNISQDVIYEPQNKLIPTPAPPNAFPDGLQDNNKGYYSIFSYSYFCYLVNTAFEVAYVILQASTTGLPSNAQPVLKYNSETKLFYITANYNLYYQNPNGVTPYVGIYLNSPLNHLYSFFTNSKVKLDGIPYHLLLINNTNANIDTTNNTITMTQELSSIGLWSQISSIVITSQTIPLMRSQTFTPALYYEGIVEPSLNNSQTQSILIEYSTEDSIYSRNIVYNPSAQYRIFELTTDCPLYNLDFQFYYRSTFGYMEPINLNSGSSASLKIGFFKKSKFNNLKTIK